MYKKIYSELEKYGKVKTALFIDGNYKGQKILLRNGNIIQCRGNSNNFKEVLAQIINCDETKVIDTTYGKIIVEIYNKNPHLIIFGGGHVSIPVAKLGKMLGFNVTIMDDREEFVSKERFPDVDKLVFGSFDEIDEKIEKYENAYYVVVTRGHMGDTQCAKQILNRPYEYFGMIGSKSKVAITRKKLLDMGFTMKQIDSIYAPIGLPIGGSLPEEVAISIMAQIVQIKNKHNISYVDENVEKGLLDNDGKVMMTIVKKTGSSPRGIGSKMLFGKKGNIYGSIGGGSVEFTSMKHCNEVKGTEVVSYNLSMKDKSNLGMICGGNIDVLFEEIDEGDL